MNKIPNFQDFILNEMVTSVATQEAKENYFKVGRQIIFKQPLPGKTGINKHRLFIDKLNFRKNHYQLLGTQGNQSLTYHTMQELIDAVDWAAIQEIIDFSGGIKDEWDY